MEFDVAGMKVSVRECKSVSAHEEALYRTTVPTTVLSSIYYIESDWDPKTAGYERSEVRETCLVQCRVKSRLYYTPYTDCRTVLCSWLLSGSVRLIRKSKKGVRNSRYPDNNDGTEERPPQTGVQLFIGFKYAIR